MPFDSEAHATNYAFALSTREMVARTENGVKKAMAQIYLHDAKVAEQQNDEVSWILAIARAAKALE